MEYRHSPSWSMLPDGVCEHVASFLPRLETLSCRLVCRTWRSPFAHFLAPLTLDTRWFGASELPAPPKETRPEPAPPDPTTSPAGLTPDWHSLATAIGQALQSVTVRVSVLHEPKARAAPCPGACAACLRFLAALPHSDLRRLQLVLPLRCALPEEATQALASPLYARLRSLRLVRCSLTRQSVVALGRLTQLRHLCIAHAELAALPQLLSTEAAAQLEHLHVHGYHSLTLLEDNPHMRRVWWAAAELVVRSRCRFRSRSGHGQATDSAGDGAAASTSAGSGCGGSGGSGGGRLRCLAVSVHHLHHNAVLDESELDFEEEAVQWQIRYDGSPCVCGGRQRRGGCCCDPLEQPRAGGEGTSAGGGSGGGTLCAAALVGLRCSCCCCGGGGDGDGGGGGGMSAAPVAGRSGHPLKAVTHSKPEPGAGGSGAVSATATAVEGAASEATRPQPPAHDVSEVRRAAEAAGLRLLRSAKRSAQLLPTAQLLTEIACPTWQDLQYVQLRLVPGPLPPPPPPAHPRLQPPVSLAASARSAPAEAEAAAGAASSVVGLPAGVSAVGLAGWGFEPPPGLMVPQPEGPPIDVLPQVPAAPQGEGARPAYPVWPPRPSLEPLNGLPALRGIWLEPGQWEEEALVEAAGEADGSGKELPRGAQAAAAGLLRPEAAAAAAAAAGDESVEGVEDVRGAIDRRRRIRWGRVGDVWTRLHEVPSGIASGAAAAAATQAPAPAQDLAAHAALLAPVTALRSLAVGRRRQVSLTRGPVLGVGDDTAELLARLTGLTKLHVSAAYGLPLHDGGASQPPDSTAVPPPPRLAALGRLTALQRLALHFSNPMGRPAVVSHAALPPSLTSLSLHGVVLVPAAAAAAAAVGGRGASGGSRQAPVAPSAYGLPCCLGHSEPSPAPRPALERLRELFLTSSYIGCADWLGCGQRLRTLSLRDSGLGVAYGTGTGTGGVSSTNTGGSTAAAAAAAMPPAAPSPLQQYDRDLVELLRKWHALQTLRIQGSTETSEDVCLPSPDRCLNHHSAAAMRAITACLPGLRDLSLAPPPPPPPYGAALAQSRSAKPPRDAAAAAGGTGTGRGPSAAAAALALASGSAGPGPGPGPGASGRDVAGAAAAVGQLPVRVRVLVPDWRLTSSGHHPDGASGTGPAGSAGAGGAGREGGAPEPERLDNGNDNDNGSGRPVATERSETAITRATQNDSSDSTDEGEPDSESGSGPGAGSRRTAEVEAAGGAYAAPGREPMPLGVLLRLLHRTAPQLRSLSLYATAPDRTGAERALAEVAALLPRGLPWLDSLSLMLDVGLPYFLAQPLPEVAVREWAARLRGLEREMQARMKFTCVCLSPHPLLTPRVREAARALGVQAARPA